MFDPFSQYVWDLFEGLFNLCSGQHVHLVSAWNLGIANLQIDRKETWRFWLFFQHVMRKIKQLLKEAAQGVYLPNNYLLPPLGNYSPIEKKARKFGYFPNE